MNPCPALEQLRHLLDDDLPPTERHLLEEHVERCPGCQQTLERLTGDSVVQPAAPADTSAQPPLLGWRRRRAAGEPPPNPEGTMDFPALAAGDAKPQRPAEPVVEGGPVTGGERAAPPSSRYTLLAEIARGGMGIVWRATDTALGREVAVKALHEKYAPDSAAAQRFADEARIAAQLQHPAIPPVHDLGTLPDGRPFLALKLIRGQTLEELLGLRADAAAERGRFVAVFEQVCQAVAYAHAHGVIHRDLKPANVMVGAFAEVQLMDWGLAKVLGAGPAAPDGDDSTRAGTQVVSLRDSDGTFTQAGSVLGTPAYMSPEQAVGAVAKVDQRSDVFGLGAILAVILTGQPPFSGGSAETSRIRAAQGKVGDCFDRLDSCGADPELVALCKRCLSPEQADRPADAGAVAQAVAELRAAADERARRAEIDRVKAEGEKIAAELQAREQRKRRWVQAALGLAFTALVVLGGTFAWWLDRQQAERRAERDRVAAEQEAERQARQARTAVGVAANLREARERLPEAWTLTDYPDRMQPAADAAVAALARAERLAADGDPTSETIADLATVRTEVQDLARHARLISDANEIVHQSAGGGFSPAHIPERLLAAMQRFGLDPSSDPEGDAVARIVASRIKDNLLAMLLEMEINVSRYQRIPMGKLSDVVRSVRQQLGGPYARWQELLERKDVPGLVAFAGTPEAVSFRAGVINALGRDLAIAGQHKAWRDLLRAGARRYPHDVWLHFDLFLASGYLGPSARAEALVHAGATVLLRPESPQTFWNLADAYGNLGEYERALDVCREAVRRFPKDYYTHRGLMEMLERSGDSKGAIAAAWIALPLEPTAERYLRLAKKLLERGLPAEAARAFREAARLEGDHQAEKRK